MQKHNLQKERLGGGRVYITPPYPQYRTFTTTNFVFDVRAARKLDRYATGRRQAPTELLAN